MQPKPAPRRREGKKVQQPKSPSSDIIHPVYFGRFDYTARTQDDLHFKKGDLMYLISTDDKDWWFVRLKETGKEGYVFRNYVSKYEQSLDTEK